MGVPMHIFVINLERSPERKAAMVDKLKMLGLEAEFVTAVDGRKLQAPAPGYRGKLRRLLFGKDLTPGEIGCAMSHFAVYDIMLKRGMERALVLEDDVVFATNFCLLIQLLEKCSNEWDMVRFLKNHKDRKGIRTLKTLDEWLILARRFGSRGGSHAYLVNQNAARRLLQCARGFWLPIDILFGQTWFHHLRVRTVMPASAWQASDLESTINENRFNKPKPIDPWERRLYFFYPPGIQTFR